MNASSLIGKIIQAVWAYSSEPVNSTWTDGLTTPITSSGAFLELSNGELIRVSPCEVKLDQVQHPSLGLALDRYTFESARVALPGGKTFDIEPLVSAAGLLPLVVTGAEESDPLGEGAVSQLRFTGDNLQSLVFRHIMPPMTLGISWRPG